MNVLPLWLVIGFICFAYFHREEDLADRANSLKKITLILMLELCVLGSVLISAEAVADPGEARGILLIEAWLLPTLILTSLTWRHPIGTVSSVASGSPYLVAERKLSHA